MYTLLEGSPSDPRPENEAAVYRFLDGHGISFVRIDHDPVRTMEDCQAVDAVLGGVICKNLFLCNQQKTVFYLLMIREEKVFKTKDISKQLGVSRLSFGPPEFMEKFLHLHPGAVSPMGLLFPEAKDVRLVLDSDLKEGEYLGCHPCVNTASIRMKMSDFLDVYLPATGHTPAFVHILPSSAE